jgi:hypothetical protein
MKRAPTVAVLVIAHLALAGGVLLFWFAAPGGPVPAYAVAVCAAPALVQGVIATGAWRDSKQLVLRSFAWALFGPILLLMWGASSELAAPPAVAPSGASAALDVDPQALSAGAVAVQQVPSTPAQVEEMRAYAFADGSELRWTRFTEPAAAARYLDFVRTAFAASDQLLGGRRGMRARIAGAERFIYWERHGRSIVELHAADEAQALARLRAQQLAPPPADAASPVLASAQPRPVWPFALGYSLVHALAVCVFIVWAGAATTRVDAVAGVRPVSSAQLLARLDALNQLGAACAVAPGTAELERVIDLNLKSDSQRAHRLTLCLDPGRSLVRVREFEGAYGAAPRDADEADMRALGEIGIDPSRPKARKVWIGKVQTTIIDPARVAQITLGFDGAAQDALGAFARQLDADGMIHLICALVVRSGFAWQPIFFGFQGRR